MLVGWLYGCQFVNGVGRVRPVWAILQCHMPMEGPLIACESLCKTYIFWESRFMKQTYEIIIACRKSFISIKSSSGNSKFNSIRLKFLKNMTKLHKSLRIKFYVYQKGFYYNPPIYSLQVTSSMDLYWKETKKKKSKNQKWHFSTK